MLPEVFPPWSIAPCKAWQTSFITHKLVMDKDVGHRATHLSPQSLWDGSHLLNLNSTPGLFHANLILEAKPVGFVLAPDHISTLYNSLDDNCLKTTNTWHMKHGIGHMQIDTWHVECDIWDMCLVFPEHQREVCYKLVAIVRIRRCSTLT